MDSSQELLDNRSPLDRLLHDPPYVPRLNPPVPDTHTRQRRQFPAWHLERFRQVNNNITRKGMTTDMARQRHF